MVEAADVVAVAVERAREARGVGAGADRLPRLRMVDVRAQDDVEVLAAVHSLLQLRMTVEVAAADGCCLLRIAIVGLRSQVEEVLQYVESVLRACRTSLFYL